MDYHGCRADVLDSVGRVEAAMNAAAKAAGATVVTSTFHRFAPEGVSGVVVLEESHLSIHTWPGRGYAAVDFYTCGDCAPERAHALLADALGAARFEVVRVSRGMPGDGPSMRVEHSDS